MLERAADYLEREFDTFTATALSLLEPAIIIVMGAIVALIVLSILLPILQLDTLGRRNGMMMIANPSSRRKRDLASARSRLRRPLRSQPSPAMTEERAASPSSS